MLDHWTVHLVSAALFYFFRLLWNIKERILNPDEKEGARIYDIAFRHNIDTIVMPSSLSYFCLRFKKAVPLSAILDENVYLYCFDRTEVAFIVVEPGNEIWRSKYGSFYKTAQNVNAQQIIRIPLQHFLTLCEDLPNPGSKLNFIHFVPRSGSTLLLQMFEETGKCITVSEPEEFIADPFALGATITHEEKVKLFSSIGKYVARSVVDTNNNQYQWYFAKVVASVTLRYFDVLKECFPESKHVFLHRNLKSTLKSSLHSFKHFPLMQILEGFVNYVPITAATFKRKFVNAASTSRHMSPEKVEQLNSMWQDHNSLAFMIAYGYCSSYDFFLNQRHVPSIKYDDLVENGQENTRRILEYFELPLDLVDKAVKAMEKDSQRNSPIAKHRIGSKSGDLKKDVTTLADDFCKLLNVPGLNEDKRHLNTITVQAAK